MQVKGAEMKKLRKYSVLLAYPESCQEALDFQTYFAWNVAECVRNSVAVAKLEASRANDGCYAAEDFLCLAVFPGHVPQLCCNEVAP